MTNLRRQAPRRGLSLIALAALVTLATQCGGAAPPRVAEGETAADLIIINGRVYTADGSERFDEAIAVRGNLIVRVGSRADVDLLHGARTQIVDAQGGAVVPGFIDSHVHLLMGAETLAGVPLRGARTAADIQERIRTHVAAHPGQPWIRGWGYFNQITRLDVDPVSGDTPLLFIAGDGHSMLANTRALALAGITRATPDPVGGEIVRDAKTGEPTGVLKETAQALMNAAVPKPTLAERRRLLALATTEAHKAGVTTLVNVGGIDEIEAYDAARAAGELKLRLHHALWLTQDAGETGLPKSFAFTEADADRFDAVRARYAADDLLKVDMVKIMLDGVIESHTAAMLAPYANRPTSGHANYTPEELTRAISLMDRRGWQIMTHALGDRAVRMALDAYEQAIAANLAPARGRRHKIEHIETIDPAEVPRFGALGVIASLQPSHAGGMNNPARTATRWANLGSERSAWGFPWKSIKVAGGRVALGSDWPVASLNPGRAFHVALHRLEHPPVPDQKLSMTEIVDGYTRDGAFTLFEESRLGTLTRGALADIVVLADDIFAAPPAEAGDLAVAATVFDGKLVYQRSAPTTSVVR